MNFPLDAITRVGWGGVRNSMVSTTFTIWFGDRKRVASVETNRQEVFKSFTDKLWRAVGVRLLVELLQGLKEGKRYRFGDIVIDDNGVEVVKHRFMGPDERVRGPWSKARIWSENGAFVVGLSDDKKAWAAASYLDVDNVHIFEAVLRTGFSKGFMRLSDLLGR